jgi:hypothetical protein
MAIGVGREPGIAIGRRQADTVQTIDLLAVGDAIALRIPIAPTVSHLAPGDPRYAVIAINDPGHQFSFRMPSEMRGSSLRSGTGPRAGGLKRQSKGE